MANVSLKPLDQQVIVLTGASSGIGLCTALMAAKSGARLVLVSPVPHEHKDGLPDPAAHRANLDRYTRALRDVATARRLVPVYRFDRSVLSGEIISRSFPHLTVLYRTAPAFRRLPVVLLPHEEGRPGGRQAPGQALLRFEGAQCRIGR